jgi:hypothetical protein
MSSLNIPINNENCELSTLYWIPKFQKNQFLNLFNKVRFILDQHAELDFYSASSLKQQSAGRNVTPFGHIILIPSQPIFALSP